jgi:hypothetical protein
MGAPISLVWGAFAGCHGADPPVGTGPAAEQGVVVGLRSLDGGLLADGRSYLGGTSPTVPDAAGFSYFLDRPPGRTPVSVELPGSAVAYASPEVGVGALAGAAIVPHPLELAEVADPHAPFDLQGDGFTVHVPADSVADRDDVLLDAPWTLGHDRIRADDRYGLPGDLLVVRNDVDVSRFVIDELIALRATTDPTTDAHLVEDAELDVTIDLDPGSPLLDPEAEAGTYVYSAGRTYWTVGGVTIDPVARTAAVTAHGFGWIALGREPERACVRGVLVDDRGHAVNGAEVTLVQDGTIGVDRVTTDNGAFCLPIDPGARADLRAFGAAPDRSAIYTWSGSTTGGGVGTCGSAACVDLGEVEAQVWADADQDRSWSGPGGDCDDDDPAVGPNPASGDGSYCGWDL